MIAGVGEEGTLREGAPDALERLSSWARAQLRRAVEWRADPTTAGLILAGVLAYFAYQNLQSADQLLRGVFDLAPAGDVYNTLGYLFPCCSASKRTLDLMALGLGVGEAVAAVGCLVLAARRGRALALAGVLLALITRVGSLIVVLGEHPSWQRRTNDMVDVVGLLLIGWVVLINVVPAERRSPRRS